MIECKAISKILNNNGITIGYKLQDETGKVMSVDSNAIKRAINNKQIHISNLQIASDGRLVYKSNKSNTKLRSKCNRISHIQRLKVVKNKKTDYTNYSDTYDFISPKVAFEYDLTDVLYTGYIKDKDKNVYKVDAAVCEGDSGRIAGGSMYFYVTIFYGDKKIKLKGYSSIFSKPHFDNIIKDLKDGYYLEDYLTKNLGAVDYSAITFAKGLIQGN